jgi:malonyl-CoA/methylmalonyl-CoA synthetase
VTLLAILATDAIAVPLSPAFPSGELRYILDQSGALMLATSPKFATKADDVLDGELQKKPILSRWEKIVEGSKTKEEVALEDMKEDKGGMMLYTSGTTNRPVSFLSRQHREETLTSSRKESFSHNPLSWLRQSPSAKHGTTHPPTISSTSCLFTTSTARSTPS